MSTEDQKEQINFNALKLESGFTYVIEIDAELSFEEMESTYRAINHAYRDTGCKFVILRKGMKIVRDSA
jgi:hypothetical protein